jgi:hypothetical protein
VLPIPKKAKFWSIVSTGPLLLQTQAVFLDTYFIEENVHFLSDYCLGIFFGWLQIKAGKESVSILLPSIKESFFSFF